VNFNSLNKEENIIIYRIRIFLNSSNFNLNMMRSVNALGYGYIQPGIKHKTWIFVHSIRSSQNKRKVRMNRERERAKKP